VASHWDDLKQLADSDSTVVSGVFRDLGGKVRTPKKSPTHL